MKKLVIILRELGIRLFPSLINGYLKWVWFTSRKQYFHVQETDVYVKNQGVLFGLFHGSFAPLIMFGKEHWHPLHVIVSPSRDGDLLASILNTCGYQVIRGDHKRNVRTALKESYKRVKNGEHVIFAVDGPLGPRYHLKPGIIHAASFTGAPIFLAFGIAKHGILFKKAWDYFQLPFPFTKLYIAYAGPFFIPPKTKSTEEIEKYRLELESELYKLIRKVNDVSGIQLPLSEE